MKRLLMNDLVKWKNNPDRKPLILNGARQVGKTWLLQNFGKEEYKSVAYINCERSENLDFVFEDYGYTCAGMESTVVLANSNEIKILRQGSINLQNIRLN